MDLNFSQRMGLTPATKAIQIVSIDKDLLNGLWNVLYSSLKSIKTLNWDSFEGYFEALWINYYKNKLDEITRSKEENIKEYFCEDLFFEWYEKYNFLEFYHQFLIQVPSLYKFEPEHKEVFEENFNRYPENYTYEDLLESTLNTNLLLEGLASDFEKGCNKILEREFSAYRFINGKLAPITNSIEIEGITNALKETGKYSAFEGSNIHLVASLKFLSNKPIPDYRNSIKESISAVEAIVRTIHGTSKDFAPAMDKIKGKLDLQDQLAAGFKNLFNYTSGPDGIRHALMDPEKKCDFDDAKYMLVSCSAFINYLIAKCVKAKISLE